MEMTIEDWNKISKKQRDNAVGMIRQLKSMKEQITGLQRKIKQVEIFFKEITISEDPTVSVSQCYAAEKTFGEMFPELPDLPAEKLNGPLIGAKLLRAGIINLNQLRTKKPSDLLKYSAFGRITLSKLITELGRECRPSAKAVRAQEEKLKQYSERNL